MDKSGKMVMIVDDEEIVRQSFTDYFEDQLWQVVQAGDSEQALALLNSEMPDCAIVDMRLGNGDGCSFIRAALKKDPRLAFVICSGSPENDMPEDFKNLPNVSPQMFQKPVADMEKLENELSRLIKGMADA